MTVLRTACPLDCPDGCTPRGRGRRRSPGRGRRRPGRPGDADDQSPHPGLHLQEGQAPPRARLQPRAGAHAARCARVRRARGSSAPAGWDEALDLVAGRVRRSAGRRPGDGRSVPLQLVGRASWAPGCWATSLWDAARRQRGRPHHLRGHRRSGLGAHVRLDAGRRPARRRARAARRGVGGQPRHLEHALPAAGQPGPPRRGHRWSWSIPAARRWPGGPTCTWPCARAPTWCWPWRWRPSSTARGLVDRAFTDAHAVGGRRVPGRVPGLVARAGRRRLWPRPRRDRCARRAGRLAPSGLLATGLGNGAQPQRRLGGAGGAGPAGAGRRVRSSSVPACTCTPTTTCVWDGPALRRRRARAGRRRRIGRPRSAPPPCEPERARRPAHRTRRPRPPVRVLFVQGANPAVMNPAQAKVLAGLARDDLFTVVHDQVLTDTARFADVVLPATTHFEAADILVPYGAYRRPGHRPRDRSGGREPHQRRGGRRAGGSPRVRGRPRRRIRPVDRAAAAPWRCREGVPGGASVQAPGSSVQFRDVWPATPDRRARLVAERRVRPGVPRCRSTPSCASSKPLTLISPGRCLDHQLDLRRVLGGGGDLADQRIAAVHLHPVDAEARGLADGQRVRVWDDRAELVTTVVVDADLRPGVASMPKGLWRAGLGGGFTANVFAPDALSDLAGGATLQRRPGRGVGTSCDATDRAHPARMRGRCCRERVAPLRR